MTEKEKMLRGELYSMDDPELDEERERARELCSSYNQLPPFMEEVGPRILQVLLGKIPEKYTITVPFWCEYGYNIEIGENFFADHNTVILDCAKVRFGKNVFVAHNCCFKTSVQLSDPENRDQGLEYGKPITVGDNVWIGFGVQVKAGVTIGDNSIIGDRSVVEEDIPSNSVAVGNPCRVIRTI